jgi:hypothetical protein
MEVAIQVTGLIFHLSDCHLSLHRGPLSEIILVIVLVNKKILNTRTDRTCFKTFVTISYANYLYSLKIYIFLNERPWINSIIVVKINNHSKAKLISTAIKYFRYFIDPLKYIFA